MFLFFFPQKLSTGESTLIHLTQAFKIPVIELGAIQNEAVKKCCPF